MATTDKTRDKLLASMRKSKTGAGSKPAAASTSAASKKTTTHRQAAQPASGNKAAALAAATMGAETRQVSTDAYQSSGRVWPD
ncbi:MAG TPA: hypothetical protein VLB10_06920 [Gammaproteobacteria bacterium]|jgi:hypothetical protein|nr:hypothetical protein [Gammaproteobacteria bacterium]